MANKKRKPAGTGRLRTIQVDAKHKELSVTADEVRGMYLQVVIKDNKSRSEVVTAIRQPSDGRLVELAITRLVRNYLRNFPLAPPQGFYSLLVIPKWVPVTAGVRDGRD